MTILLKYNQSPTGDGTSTQYSLIMITKIYHVCVHAASRRPFFSAQFAFYIKQTRCLYRNYPTHLTDLRDSIE